MEVIEDQSFKVGSFNNFMTHVYSWMALGLGLTAFVSFMIMNSNTLFEFLISNKYIYFGLILVEIGIVIALNWKIDSMNYATAVISFLFYSVMSGVTLTPVLYVYTTGSVATAFFTTSAMFIGMSFAGYVIKRDLSHLASFFMIALIGFMAALIINIFLRNTIIDFAISILGVLLFAGLTVYDTQRIRKMANGMENKYTIVSALSLYLNFINMFINILRLIGRRN